MGPPDGGMGAEKDAHFVGSKSHRILGALFKDMDTGRHLTSVKAVQTFCRRYFVGWINITGERFVRVFPEPCNDLGRWEALKFRFYGPDSEHSLK